TDGKVDEIMIAGHGNAKSMQLAGKTKDGEVTSQQRVKANDPDSEKFLNEILAHMEKTPNARQVLNACLTNSNKVSIGTLDPDPKKAAAQVKAAITADPSLATWMRGKAAGQVEVRGSNASFGQVEMTDALGRMDIRDMRPGGDKELTNPDKLKYAEFGIEPT